MKTSKRAYLFRGTALVAFLGSACTFVNSFDDVKPSGEGQYAPGVATADAAATQSDGAVKTPALGAIVMSGQEDSDGQLSPVLAVLDPATGKELAKRESMAVASVRYDGLRDLWYIFESTSGSIFPGPQDEVKLHVRSFDLTEGTWTELGSVVVPPIQNYDSLVVVRERLLYVAHGADAGTTELVTIDTSDQTKPKKISETALDRAPRGLVGTRSSIGAGGTVTMIRTGATGAGCEQDGAVPASPCPEVIRVRVGTGEPSIEGPVAIGGGQSAQVPPPAFASFASLNREVFVYPRLAVDAGSGPVTSIQTIARLYEPVNQDLDPTSINFLVNDSLLRRAAVSECSRLVFLVAGNSDLNLYAIPVTGDGTGTVAKAPTGHSGQAVYYEPSSKTVLAPFGQGQGFDLTAFHVGGSASAPTLDPRTSDWAPPKDIRPVLLEVREPIPIVCN